MTEREPTTVLDYVAERLMEHAGYSREGDRGTHGEREWDPSDPESQYSILRDVADAAIDAAVEAIGSLEALADDGPDDGGVVVSTVPGSTLADVAGWLNVCAALGLPEDTPVSGALSAPIPDDLPLPPPAPPTQVTTDREPGE